MKQVEAHIYDFYPFCILICIVSLKSNFCVSLLLCAAYLVITTYTDLVGFLRVTKGDSPGLRSRPAQMLMFQQAVRRELAPKQKWPLGFLPPAHLRLPHYWYEDTEKPARSARHASTSSYVDRSVEMETDSNSSRKRSACNSFSSSHNTSFSSGLSLFEYSFHANGNTLDDVDILSEAGSIRSSLETQPASVVRHIIMSQPIGMYPRLNSFGGETEVTGQDLQEFARDVDDQGKYGKRLRTQIRVQGDSRVTEHTSVQVYIVYRACLNESRNEH
jgi:hypothetical protein